MKPAAYVPLPGDTILRSLVDDDRPLVYSSWAKGAREMEPYRSMPLELYSARQSTKMQETVGRCSSFVAVFPEDPDTIAGYVLYELRPRPTMFWIWVRNELRRHHIGSKLFLAAFASSRNVVFPQRSKHTGWLSLHWPLVFDPYVS